MIIDDARLAAYLDGRLDARARAEVEAALASDPLLAARLARHRARHVHAYDPAAEDDVHERLHASAGASGRDNVVRLADRRAPPHPHRPRMNLKWPAWGGIAATFVGGLALGFGAARETGGPLAVRGDGALTAHGDLVRVLNENRSGQPGPIRIGLSFRTADHRYCRTFQMDARRLAGVACREGAGWVARMTATSPPLAKGEAAPLSVLGAVDGMMAGETLDQPAEALARARGWKD
ncbi:MAG TPA: hypothetical protein VFW47_08835 [Phenylobacterium sp.]|nr:hypothetical protein [Phenylobacterium sp.]